MRSATILTGDTPDMVNEAKSKRIPGNLVVWQISHQQILYIKINLISELLRRNNQKLKKEQTVLGTFSFSTGVPNPQAVAHYWAVSCLELGHRSGKWASINVHTSPLAREVGKHMHMCSICVSNRCTCPPLTQMELRAHACLPATHIEPFPLLPSPLALKVRKFGEFYFNAHLLTSTQIRRHQLLINTKSTRQPHAKQRWNNTTYWHDLSKPRHSSDLQPLFS